jgi:hypothetical protein
MALVYRINPIRNTNEIRIKFLGNSAIDEKLTKNVPVEFKADYETVSKYGENTIYFGKHGDYEVKGKIYFCNISDDYILKNDKYPLFYLSIIYEKQFVSGFLFAVFINFKPDEKITNIKEVINSDLHGKFTVEFSDVDGFTTKILDKVCEKNKEEIMMKYIKEFESLDEGTKELNDLLEKIDFEIKEINKNLKEFSKGETLDKYTKIEYIIDNIFLYYTKNKHFLSMIDAGLNLVDYDRRGQQPEGNFNLPTKIINMRTVMEHPENIEKIIEDNDRGSEDDEI